MHRGRSKSRQASARNSSLVGPDWGAGSGDGATHTGSLAAWEVDAIFEIKFRPPDLGEVAKKQGVGLLAHGSTDTTAAHPAALAAPKLTEVDPPREAKSSHIINEEGSSPRGGGDGPAGGEPAATASQAIYT